MYQSVFVERDHRPDPATFAKALGPSHPFWLQIKENLNHSYGELIEEWKFYGSKSGWLQKMLKKKRNLFFLIPMEDFFVISFVFGDKAVKHVLETDLPEKIKSHLRNTRKYAEGRGLPIEVRSEREVEQVVRLVEIKVNN